MNKPLEYDGRMAYTLVDQIEQLIIAEQPTYADVLVACLSLAVIAANNMHMKEDMFLSNCQLVFAQDKIEKLKEMQ